MGFRSFSLLCVALAVALTGCLSLKDGSDRGAVTDAEVPLDRGADSSADAAPDAAEVATDAPADGGDAASDDARDVADVAMDAPGDTAMDAPGDTAMDAPGDTVAPCGASQLRCGAGCIDPMTDGSNCGMCGRTCSLGQVCVAGSCACPVAGQTFCAGLGCLNTASDTAHCGGCDTRCADGQLCSSGACRCPTGFTLCGSVCVDTSSSATSCGACGTSCEAAFANAVSVCASGRCVQVACQSGFGDCGAASGCETDTRTDADNCGACNTRCRFANAAASCAAGACVMGACNTGFADCNRDPADGCETNTQTGASDCGRCGNACTAPTGRTAFCVAGACMVGASCTAPLADCDGVSGNGCEVTLTSDASNCGACGSRCTFANAAASCASSACVMGACSAGFGNCDGSATNGCEADLATNASHCGRCGSACSFANASATCSGGACGLGTCNAGFGNCDGMAANGCETNTATTVAHCGACGRACSFANASATCSSGVCALGACNAGFADCDGVASNGCETVLATDVAHCGRCGNRCVVSNGTAACAAGACRVATCGSSFGDCNGDPTDGCETNTQFEARDCGRCGNVCTAPAGRTPYCLASTCMVGGSCTTPLADCDGASGNGCEVTLASDASNCGACGNRCAFANAAASCASSACVMGACSAGFGDCDSGATNGCETNLNTTATHCGACGRACAARTNATASCSAGACVYTCAANFADCDGNAANGCETPTATDAANCGGCGVTCATNACVAGGCVLPVDVVMGTSVTCARMSDGTVRCWGYNIQGQRGDGGARGTTDPPSIVSGLSGVVEIAASAGHVCARLSDGTVRCWGDNNSGAIGDGTTTNRNVPVVVTGLSGAVGLAVGTNHACALISGGSVRCWGESGYGQIGDGTRTNRLVATTVSGLTGASEIAAGGAHTCARRTDGTVRCWGWNVLGQIGNTGTSDALTSTAVVSLSTAARVFAGGEASCALLMDGAAFCWGSNNYSLLSGALPSGPITSPSMMSLGSVSSLSLGGFHLCARLTDGTVRCQGNNQNGQLGLGMTSESGGGIVPGLTGVVQVVAGYRSSCARLSDGAVRCWGNNDNGVLGDGTSTSRTSPVSVVWR